MMELVRRVFTNVVNTIFPDSVRERNTTARKRSAGSYEPELTDDEEAPESYFSKRMRPSVEAGQGTSLGTRVLFEKPFGADASQGRVVPIELTCENVRAAGKSKQDDVVAVAGSSIASNSRRSAFDSSVSPFPRNNVWLPKKDALKKMRTNNFIAKRFRKNALPVYETFKQNLMRYCPSSRTCTDVDVVRLEERSAYVKMVDSMMAMNNSARKQISSKPSTSVDSGRSSQNGSKPLPFVKSKEPESELMQTTMDYLNFSHVSFYAPLASTPISAVRSIQNSVNISLIPQEVPSPKKVIDTIDISRESDSDDGVICETPASTPKPAFTPTSLSRMNKSVSAKKLESLGERIQRVLENSFREIEKSFEEGNGENESSINSSEKENDEEPEAVSPFSLRPKPINTLALDLQNSPYAKENWLKTSKSSFAESRRERAEKIKRAEKEIEILQKESTLERDLAEIVRRNLTLTDIIILEEPEEERKLPEITDAMRDVITRARSPGRGLGEVITTTVNNIQITKSDIKSLAPMQWLNDNVINSYLDLVALRSKSNDRWPTVYVFTTFFYPKFLNEGYSNILKRWTRKVDLFSYDLLIFPIHLGIHWCLAVADIRKKMIKYYDSLGGRNTQCPKALLNYLCKEHQERKKSSLGECNWKLEIVEEIPQQQNGSDCGMFACKFAEYLSRDAKLSFRQEDMNYYRERMIYEIISGDLMYP